MDRVHYRGILSESQIWPKSNGLDRLNHKTSFFNIPKAIKLNENHYVIARIIRTCYVQCNTKQRRQLVAGRY